MKREMKKLEKQSLKTIQGGPAFAAPKITGPTMK
jgi:hypothetical protein